MWISGAENKAFFFTSDAQGLKYNQGALCLDKGVAEDSMVVEFTEEAGNKNWIPKQRETQNIPVLREEAREHKKASERDREAQHD